MRKKISIFLFILIGLSVLGPFPILKFMEWRAKEDAEQVVKQSIPEAELQVFVNPSSDKNLVWEEEGEEFYYKGSLYDVVKKESKDGKDLYYCYNDKKEAAVFNGLQDLLYTQINDDHSSTGAVHRYLLKTFVRVFIGSKRIDFSPAILQEAFNKQHFFLPPCNTVFFEVISPPPKFC